MGDCPPLCHEGGGMMWLKADCYFNQTGVGLLEGKRNDWGY